MLNVILRQSWRHKGSSKQNCQEWASHMSMSNKLWDLKFKEQSCCLESTPLWPQTLIRVLDYTAQLSLLNTRKPWHVTVTIDTWNVGNRYTTKQQTARTHEMLETAIISILSYIIIIILTNQTATLKNPNSFYDFAS